MISVAGSAIWSLCKWVKRTADNLGAHRRPPLQRATTQSQERLRAGPHQSGWSGTVGSGMGLPVPSNVISSMALSQTKLDGSSG